MGLLKYSEKLHVIDFGKNSLVKLQKNTHEMKPTYREMLKKERQIQNVREEVQIKQQLGIFLDEVDF